MWKNMLENHDLIQLSGIIGIVVTYVLVVVFNTVNGVGGKARKGFFNVTLPKIFSRRVKKLQEYESDSNVLSNFLYKVI